MINSNIDMFKRNHYHPLWYKVWQVAVAISAVYILIKVFTPEGLTTFGYSLLVFTHLSLLLDMYFFRRGSKSDASKEVAAYPAHGT